MIKAVDMFKDTELQHQYGLNAVCGYVRNPTLFTETNIIEGSCAITGGPCSRTVPMNELECKVYLNMAKIVEQQRSYMPRKKK